MKFWNRREEPAALDRTPATPPTEADLQRAYERGRRDERARHKGHPVIGLLLALVALMGVGLIYLAAREGSFSRGGEVIDRQISVATNGASSTASKAVTGAGDKMTGAGEKVKEAGQSLRQDGSQP